MPARVTRVVAISRAIGSEGERIGALVSDRLGFRYVDEEIITTAAEKQDVDPSMIADAERLVRERPLREGRWAILAIADYRADRQADALAVLREARRRLREFAPPARYRECSRPWCRRCPRR